MVKDNLENKALRIEKVKNCFINFSSPTHKNTKNQADREFLVKTVEVDFSNSQK